MAPKNKSNNISLFETVLNRLKPLLLRRWQVVSQRARQELRQKTPHEANIYMEGFQKGYWAGVVDGSKERLTTQDLQDPVQAEPSHASDPTNEKVH